MHLLLERLQMRLQMRRRRQRKRPQISQQDQKRIVTEDIIRIATVVVVILVEAEIIVPVAVVAEPYLQIRIRIIKVTTRIITTRIRAIIRTRIRMAATATVVAMVEAVAPAGVTLVARPTPSSTGAAMVLVTKTLS